MKKVFEQWSISGLKLKNRIVAGAALQPFVAENGTVTAMEADDLEAKAAGGASMIITGMMGVGGNARVFPQMIDVSAGEFVRTYQPVVERVHAAGALLAAQLCNCGLKATVIDRCDAAYAPSDRRDGGRIVARAMTEGDIVRVTREFADAAAKCMECGLDAVEVHAAHGYLLSQFLSPRVNFREDAYGGSLENRSRFLLEVVRATRKTVGPDYPILVKINGSDQVEGGMTREESCEVCKMLQDCGASAIEVSGGSVEDGLPATRPGIRLETQGTYVGDAAYIAERIDIPVICVCGFRTPDFVQETLNGTGIAAISMTRPLIREPELPSRWESGDVSPSTCVSCNRCFAERDRGCPILK